ncbi:SDR family oxidoreductase [Patescibacteria group bacterium]|nr:SDR family oxidoreductase [Patescibacteria group bacterium]
MKFKGKVVLITGASKGLGKALAETLAKEGIHVFICARDKSKLKGVCNSIIRNHGRCEYFIVDVTKRKQVEKFVDTVYRSAGKIDILLNNAGTIHPKKFIENITDKEYESCMKTNINSVFYFMQKVIPLMKKQNEGMVINISSGAGKRGYGQLSVYSASKFAVQGLTQSVAWELRGTKVSCISVSPGGINTRMREKIFGKKDSASQQDPKVVANIIKKIIEGTMQVSNGEDIEIRGGKVTAISSHIGA